MTKARFFRRISAAAMGMLAIVAAPAVGQGPAPKATPFLPIQGEADAKLYVDPPLAGPLAERGTAVIPYRLDNFRILPVFGAAATALSPRVGHLHVTVDDLPWHWADAGNTDAVVVAGLAPGRHNVLIELATPEHRVVMGRKVEFVVPRAAASYPSVISDPGLPSLRG